MITPALVTKLLGYSWKQYRVANKSGQRCDLKYRGCNGTIHLHETQYRRSSAADLKVLFACEKCVVFYAMIADEYGHYFLDDIMVSGWKPHKNQPYKGRCDLKNTCKGSIAPGDRQWNNNEIQGPHSDGTYACTACVIDDTGYSPSKTSKVVAGNKPEDAAMPSTGVLRNRFHEDMLKSNAPTGTGKTHTPQELTERQKQNQYLDKLREKFRVRMPEHPTHVLGKSNHNASHPEYTETLKHYGELVVAAREASMSKVRLGLTHMPTCYKCHQPMKITIVEDIRAGYLHPEWFCEDRCNA